MDQNFLDMDQNFLIQCILESLSWSKIQNHLDPRLKLFGHGPKIFGHGPKLFWTYIMTGHQIIVMSF